MRLHQLIACRWKSIAVAGLKELSSQRYPFVILSVASSNELAESKDPYLFLTNDEQFFRFLRSCGHEVNATVD